MTGHTRPNRRIRIDRLELDVRGIDPATASAAAHALGAALERALAAQHAHVAPASRIDAGRVESPASPDANRLATGIAQRIAHSIGREKA